MDNTILNKVTAHLNQNNFSDALQILNDIECKHIKDAGYWEILALTQGMSGNNEECMNACLQAIRLNPGNIGTYINLGLAQQNLGLLSESEKTLQKALTINSEHPQVQNNLGALYILQAEFNKALPYIEKALAVDPKYSDAHCNLGEIYKNLQKNDAAINSFLKSIELNTYSINAYVGLGTLFSFSGDFEQAEIYLSKAIELNPYHTEAFFNLGFLHYLKKSYDTAVTYFKKTIELSPNHTNANYLISAITGEKPPEQSPELYVKELFNHYSDTFDEHLVNTLGYGVPETMYSIFTEKAQSVKLSTMLDLGCGTGICGEKFHNICNQLDGIDLSEKMLTKAKDKNIYDQLHCKDIAEFLNRNTKKYDLIVAADVFIYIGNITELVKIIYDQQENEGYFLFSIEESSKHDSFHLRNTGRYSHSENYINTILKVAGYKSLVTHTTIIRNEKGNEINGLIYLCQK